MPKVLRHLDGGATSCVAFLALLTAGVGLLWDFFPDLRPEQRNNRLAVASITTVDRNVSRFAGRATACPTSTRPVELGAVVYLKYKAKGFKNGRLRLRCSVFDADLHTPLSPTVPAQKATDPRCRAASTQDRAAACGYVSVPTDTTDERAVKPLWVTIPPSRVNIRVRVAIYTSDDDTMLAYADSPTFRPGIFSSPLVRQATSTEEHRIGHFALKHLPRDERGGSYVAAVAILRGGAAFARNHWASADVRPFPSFKDGHQRIVLLHRRTAKYWKPIPRSARCDVPREVLELLGLPRARCTLK